MGLFGIALTKEAKRRKRQKFNQKMKRKDARLARKAGRQSARAERKAAKVSYKGESGYWSPEAVASRQESLRTGIGAAANLAELGIGAATGGASMLGSLGKGGDVLGGLFGSQEAAAQAVDLPMVQESSGLSPAAMAGIAAGVVILLVVVAVAMSKGKG